MPENEDQFVDAESYSMNFNKDQLSFKFIVLQHLQRIGQYASVEFRGGFWEEKPHPNIQVNSTIQVYVPDTREVYSNAVEYLADILYPYFDKDMKKSEEEAQKELQKAFENNTIVIEKDREDKNIQEGKIVDRIFKKQEDKVFYRSERVKINRKLFRNLCSLLYRKKYLELGKIED